MAIKPKFNLAEYFQNNLPASSQVTPIGQMTYPPIGPAGATAPFNPQMQDASTVTQQGFPLGAYQPQTQGNSTVSGQYGTPSIVDYFNNTYAMGFTQNATAGTPSNYVGIDANGTSMSQPLLPSNGAVNYFANTFSLGFTSNMGFLDSQYVGISGTPGSQTYTQPTNQQISSVDFMGNTNKTGFTTGRQAMDPSEFTGIGGQPGGMTYSGAPSALTQTDYFANLFANGFVPNKVHLDSSDIAGISGTPGAMDYTPTTPLPSATSVHGNPTNAFNDAAGTGFHQNEVHLGPSRYVGVMGTPGAMTYTNPIPSALGLAPGPVNYFTDTAQTGFTLNQPLKETKFVGVDGQPGGMTYTNPMPHPEFGSGPGDGVDYMGNDARPGFDKNFTTGTPSKYVGIEGSPGSMTYTNPMPMTTPTHGLNLATNAFLNKRDTWNENNRYGSNEAATQPRYLDLDDDFSQVQSIYNDLISKHAAVTTQMIKKGIQVKDGAPVGNFNGTDYQPGMGGLQLRLPAALEYGYKRIWPLQFDFGRSNFLLNRGILKLYSMQSQFRVGDAPFHWLRGTVLLPWIDPFAAIGGLIPGIAGTVAGLPMKLKTLGPGTYARKNSIFKRFGLGVSDINFKRKNALSAIKSRDKQLAADLVPSEDLIPFYFHNINLNTIIQFRGTMKTINHAFSPQWSQKRYFGRPDPVWKYGGYSSTLSFSFTVYANSPEELWPMYTSIDSLIGLTKPQLDTKGANHQIAPISTLTIGDLYTRQPGVIQSLSVAPDEQVPWDIGYLPGEGLLGRPMQLMQVWGEKSRDIFDKKDGVKIFQPKRNRVLPRVFNITVQFGLIEKKGGSMNDSTFHSDKGGLDPITNESNGESMLPNKLKGGWNDSNALSGLKKSILGGKDYA